MFLILEIWHFVLVVNIHISDIERLLVSTNKYRFIQDQDRPKIEKYIDLTNVSKVEYVDYSLLHMIKCSQI